MILCPFCLCSFLLKEEDTNFDQSQFRKVMEALIRKKQLSLFWSCSELEILRDMKTIYWAVSSRHLKLAILNLILAMAINTVWKKSGSRMLQNKPYKIGCEELFPACGSLQMCQGLPEGHMAPIEHGCPQLMKTLNLANILILLSKVKPICS